MNQTRKRVSLVIPAYNEERHLRACLQAVARQTVQPLEVIVVDNNSSDGTARIARSFPFVRLLHEPRQGRVFARNAGFNAARGEIIGRIDADIILPKKWIQHVAEFYEQPQNEDWAWTGSGFFPNMRFPRLVSWGYSMLAFRLNWLLLRHYTLWGSNMALPARQWRRVAAKVCERNDIHEDLDLAIHLHRASCNIRYDTRIKTNAELRRVHAGRHELWDYLQWWPRTLRIHGNHLWPLVWLVGALILYLLSFVFVAAEYLARRLGRPPRGE